VPRLAKSTARFAKTHARRRQSPASGIEEAIRADFRSLPAVRPHSSLSLAVPGANVEGFVAEAEARFLEECNYALEARRQVRFGGIFAGHASITIPAVHLDACGPRVLTSTWHDGAGLMPFLGTAVYAAERTRAARALYEFYVAHSTATGSSTPIHTRATYSSHPTAA